MVETVVVLDDAFAKRTFEPQQIFHFDEAIPETVRVDDIKLALRDLQFVVEPERTARDEGREDPHARRVPQGDAGDPVTP